MKRLVSVLAGIFVVALIGVALIGVGCSDDDSPTGGGTPEGTVAVPMLVAEVVCPDSYSDTLTDRVSGELQLISVHGGHLQTMHFESSGIMTMNVEPGEYEVRVHSRRCDSEVIMPGILTVVNVLPGNLVVQNQAPAGDVPAMRVVDGTLSLINRATILDPDTVRVLFRYPKDDEGMSPQDEVRLIEQLNDATGRHFDVRNLHRDPPYWQPANAPYYEYRYTIAVDDAVYLTDHVDRCIEYMTAHSDVYPRETVLMNAGYQLPCMYIINFNPGGIILD